MSGIWDTFFLEPLINGLIFLYNLTGNLGVAIVLFTIVVRFVLTPLTLPSLRTAKKMRELSPHLERLKIRHKDDKTKLAQAQMDLYKQHGVNPASGCIPQIVQIVILIALFQAFYAVFTSGGEVVTKLNTFLWPPLKLASDIVINTHFLFLDLTRPNVFTLPGFPLPLPGLLLVASAIVQFLSSKIMLPEVSRQKGEAGKTPGQMDDFATSMQESMLWIFPLTTLIIGYTFPSGVVLYWLVFSLFQLVQQYFVSGWGGLTPWVMRFNKQVN